MLTKAQLGSNLAAARKAARMTQGGAAARILCSARTVRRWEAGRFTPSVLDLARAAEVYGTTVGALLTPEPAQEQAAA